MSCAAIPGFRSFALPIEQVCLSAVLSCGQSFRWQALPLCQNTESSPALIELATDSHSPTHEYRLTLNDRVICLRQTQQQLFYRALYPKRVAERDERELDTLQWIKSYFQVDVDLVELYNDWSDRDSVFRSLRHRFEGIRILRQDPWENLISFICSSNNNIGRITKMVQNLCIHFSPPVLHASIPDESTNEQPYHSFPLPSALAAPEVESKLRSLGFGYRAGFIQRTAQMLLSDHFTDEGVYSFLQGLRQTSTEDAREKLLKLMGVGRKVADCVLLMSIDKREVVPVDTHVHQIAVKHYNLRGASGKQTMSPKLYDEVQTKLAKVWGPWAGWAHTVLFTADLRSFQNYGLPTPSPSPEKKKNNNNKRSPSELERSITTPVALLLSSAVTKRKFEESLSVDPFDDGLQAEEPPLTPAGSDGPPISNGSLSAHAREQEDYFDGAVDRVKRRRRTPLTRSLSSPADIHMQQRSSSVRRR